ncbi:hypothetical protein G647_05087 [Cladophialophora carrionii CBS 160.54]|uniref:Cyclin N-terminal domain-containing protein n=1 Tax=Cladophialophora carrionii CBS 160.54 TaxID=1279043 RepID=V9DBE1_9EURO|nr:uncharacterized protein G647_05087 [Cladophialophora carrionii CBS 160.54]ETI23287.1 hypothetical protein G647_05087 [Cladophialophora carrionii CBS 160.54]
MGLEGVVALSDSLAPHNVQDSIPAWLSNQQIYDPVYRPTNPLSCKRDVDSDNLQGPWIPNLGRSKQDTDQSSIASVDDDVSVSDSAHGSYSSEASSQTSWTSTTASSDTFMDEDGKEQLPNLTKTHSHPALECQEQIPGGIQNNEQSALGAGRGNCPIDNAFRGLTGGVSKFCRRACPGRPQQPPQTSSKPWLSEASLETTAQHCRTRRSACSLTRSCPPKLKRDTDVTEQFVALLIIFAKRLITAIWPSSDCPPMNTDCFGAGVLPLETFIRETLRRSKTSFSTLQVALYYLILLKARMPQGQVASRCRGDTAERTQCRAMQCGRRMFLSALMLASKYLQDRNYSARAWSKISGLRSNEINENEREYLATINYDLHVPKDTFENWSKIVLVLSKLSTERPCFTPGLFDAHFGPPGAGLNTTSLAAMVSQVDLDESLQFDQQIFTSQWWTGILQKLDPSIVKESPLVDRFLRANLPSNKLHIIASLPHLSKEVNRPLDYSSSSNSATPGEDLNFGDLNNARNPQASGVHGSHTPQTPVPMSPASGLPLPSRPQLGNLPTPQTTPRLQYQFTGEKTCSRPSLRLAASMDAMRSSLRKECFRKASLERCPPPHPQDVVLPSLKHLMRSAETIQELPSRTTTPLTSSPASVSSDSTCSTSRSRSSSISSVSSWSSSGPIMPHVQRRTPCGFGSTLSRVCSLPDRSYKPLSTDRPMPNRDFGAEACSVSTSDQTPASMLSDEDPVDVLPCRSPGATPTSSEVAAIHGLMSLSTQSETSSQSVTPTPQHLSEHAVTPTSQLNGRSKHHKRKHSKTEPTLQAQVRSLVWDGSWSVNSDVVEDHLLPSYGAVHRQLQAPTSLRRESRVPVLTPMNNKRLCSLQHTPSALQLPEQLESNLLMCR